MNEQTKRELAAIGKIAIGGARIASGIATVVGKGLLGSYCRNHNLTRVGLEVGRSSVNAGAKMIEDGWSELNG